MKSTSLVHLGAIALVSVLSAQSAGAQDTRAENAAQAQAEKARSSSSAVSDPSALERAFTWATNKMDRADGTTEGFYPELGGLIPGSGLLSIGPGYRHLFGQALVLDASAAVSSRRYAMLQSRIEWPKVISDRVSVGAQVKYQDFTQINYFGVGSDTSTHDQTDYRLRGIDAVASITAHPHDRLAVGGRVGYIRGLRIEPGLSSIHPSIAERFEETDAPGLARQPRYQHEDVFLETDWRDRPGYPTSGGIYRIGLSSFHDVDGSRYAFRRVDVDAVQYVPLFHKNWVVALRGRVALSQTASGEHVPFYLLPALGGENSLRGYADYRFRDRNLAMFSAEYRWTVFRMMDAALFTDAGAVSPTAAALLDARRNADYGFGLRLHSTTRSIANLDVAKGREGFRIVASLSAPLRVSSRNVIPYVP